MDPTQLASTIATLQGIVTGTVGCTVVLGVAAVLLWKRLNKVQDEQKTDLAALTKEVREEVRLNREQNARVENVLEAILVELRRRNGVEPSLPELRVRGGG